MAYLTRRPNTYLARLLLLPLVIIITFRCTIQYQFEDTIYGWYDWVRGLVALALTTHAIYFAVIPEGTLKIGESHSADDNCTSSEDDTSKGHNSHRLLPACISDALEIGLAARGIGWQYARGMYIPRARRSSERGAYLRATLWSVAWIYLFLDFIHCGLEALPGVTATSGTIFFPTLSPLLRYIVSTALTVCAGFVVILGVQLMYDIWSLVGVGLLHQSPALWPPIHDSPWHICSLHEFWSKRWHQALRHTFLVLGGYPGQWLAGDIGMLFGTFLASGLFHETGIYLGGAPFDIKVVVFFLAQAFGILAEKLYKKHTGRRVDGWLGFVSVGIFVAGFGQLCVNAWVERGGGGKILVPPSMSLCRRVLFPLIRTFLKGTHV